MPTSRNCAAFQRINAGILLACVIGLGLSCYAYIVKIKMDQDDLYEAMCDISERVSCTKVFKTEYSKGFGLMPKNSILNIQNPIYGLGFYTLVAVLSMINNYSCSAAVVALGVVSNILSVYLGYILYMYNTICVVCVATYFVNMTILYLGFKKFRKLPIDVASKKKMK